jgi:outer membrane murein-binding lipoprotein Lpp
MGRRLALSIIFTALIMLAGCATTDKTLQLSTLRADLEALKAEGAAELLPAEYSSADEAVREAERFEADGGLQSTRYRKLALLKIQLLSRNLSQRKGVVEEERRLQQETERQRQAEEGRQKQEHQEEKELESVLLKIRGTPDQQLLSSYTVKRGESLPQIAARPDIYNDASLWPLIYRANRDQIRDPAIIWPGQVLLISRDITVSDIIEARKFEQKHPLR